MKFYHAFNYPASKAEPECSLVMDELQLDASTGKLVKTGTIPYYERIQSHADSCRLDAKIRRYQQGDTLALGVPGGTYGDFSGQPTDLQTVLQARNAARDEFNQLSPAIRAVFNDSYDEFTKSLQDGSYESRLASYAAGELKKIGSLSGIVKDSGNSKSAEGGAS